jgi:ferredoxin
LAGGHLIKEVESSIDFVRKEVGIPVIAVGMLRREELEMNLAIFEGKPVPAISGMDNYRKRTKVTFLCKGCGRCLNVCHSDAIRIVNGQALIDNDKCLLCGYCSKECPEFAIRVI